MALDGVGLPTSRGTYTVSAGDWLDDRFTAIQQGQLSIINDGQNHALFLIATVSAVFVPISTPTRYERKAPYLDVS